MRYAEKPTAHSGLVLKTGQVPRPSTGEAVIEVDTAGICGSDLHAYELIPEYSWVQKLLPVVLGHEVSGVVYDYPDIQLAESQGLPPIGSRVAVQAAVSCSRCTQCRLNRPELCSSRSRLGFERHGGLSTHVTTPVSTLYPIKENVDREAASLVEPLTIALNALRLLPSPVGARATVVGMGAIGLLMTELLIVSGASEIHVVGTPIDEEIGSFEICKELGANPHLSNSSTLHHLDASSEIVVNTAGAKSALRQSIQFAAPKASVGAIALGIGTVEVDIDRLVRNEINLIGVYGNRPEHWQDAVALVNSETVRGSGIVSHWLPLEDADEGFRLLRDGKARKVCITPNE